MTETVVDTLPGDGAALAAEPAHAAELPRPVGASERIASIDALRGVALLGILLMNIGAMGLPYEAYTNPTIDGATAGAPFVAWWIMMVFFEGSMRTIFSMLFGASVVLLTSRAGESVRTADVYYRRTIWLVIFGMVHGYLLLWPGDILYHYGLVGLFLFPLRNARPRRLAISGAVVLALLSLQGIGLSFYINGIYAPAQAAQTVLDAGGELTEEQQTALDEWRASPVYEPTEAEIEEQMALRRGGYVDNLAYAAPHTFEFETTFAYLVGFWDALAMMLLGMALFKWGVFDARRSYRDYALMTVVGLSIGLATNYYETMAYVASGFHPAGVLPPTYGLGRMGLAFGYIGLVMLFCKTGILGWLRSSLAGVGRMALTNYVSHSVITGFIFFGSGLGLVGQLERHELYYVVGGIWILQLIVSPLWLRHYRYGPLEWLWRSLTYRRRQPMAVS